MKKILSLLVLLFVATTAWPLPFVPTTSPSTKPIHWYQLKTGNLYVYASTDSWGESELDVSSSASTDDKYLWCFVGDDSRGYKIYNRGTKNYLYGGQFLGSETESSVDYYEAGNGNNFYIYTILTVWGSTQTLKNYLCYQSGEGFYTTRGKDSYFTVTEALVEEMEKTPDPVIHVNIDDRNCVISATGSGTVRLYINYVEVTNPYTIARTDKDLTVTVTASALETGKEFTSVSQTVTIPRLENPEPDPDPTVEITLTPYAFNTPNNVGNIDGEGYDKLFDKNKSTKWCVVNPSGAWQTIWVDFKSNLPIIPTGYILTTGNDTFYYSGRNPKVWTIYGKAKESDAWTTLTKVTDGSAAGLGTSNNTDYSFAIAGNTNAYQYFRFEVSEVQGKDGWDPNNYVFQLSEFEFVASAASVTGDVNGDGVVDVDDLNILINIMIHKNQDPSLETRADVDGSGVVDVDDLNRIINIMVGKS
ncbi:MAG: hypothetical protein IKR25_06820 [Muribaculaceae bacterium]|nr:hypothetical protein [Muribaculaceae bacterium]